MKMRQTEFLTTDCTDRHGLSGPLAHARSYGKEERE